MIIRHFFSALRHLTLYISKKYAIITKLKNEYGLLAQLGERKVRNLEARGSIPL